jgi:predicted nucleotidyltransferase component of viral defense system
MDFQLRAKQSEILQLVLLDQLYARSGAEKIVFQGGTALRWAYNGVRFSEDLAFTTALKQQDLEKVLNQAFVKAHNACIAHFGPGNSETNKKGRRPEARKVFYVFRPESQRERIAVKLEFEEVKGNLPEFEYRVLRDLPAVRSLISTGLLFFSSSSSVVAVETLEEILSDKIRALYERKYLKGRDIFDLWWITRNRELSVDICAVEKKLEMYQAPFVPSRKADFFVKPEVRREIVEALKSDLPRFLPPEAYRVYLDGQFAEFIEALERTTRQLIDQGMADLLSKYG